MKSKDLTDYYIGLDIGTDSVGWAVTDPEYNIADFRGKAMWGIHLFDAGKTAEDRRLKRNNRRRIDRRHQRIVLLQELFDEEVCKVDPLFFQRLEDSFFNHDDKRVNQRNSLFNDPCYKDKDYHEKFPTIYHLRYYLMNTTNKPDIRLIYLAIHHILKYRGHFLFDLSDEDSEKTFSDVMNSLFEVSNDRCGTSFDFDLVLDSVQEIMMSDAGAKEKKDRIQKLFNPENECEKQLLTLLSGSTADLSKMFSGIGDKKISFKLDDDFEKAIVELESVLDTDDIQVLMAAKSVASWCSFKKKFRNHKYISEVKMDEFQQHRDDLKQLKKMVKSLGKDAYEDMFRKPKENKKSKYNNYCAYSGVIGRKTLGVTVSCTQEEFCKYVKGVLKDADIPESMRARLDDNTFMPLQRSRANSDYPNSCHRTELRLILNNMEKFYPFLSTMDEDGKTVSEKLMSICTFRIPYYVGPLNSHSKNSWVSIRDEAIKVRPWNFESAVDLDECAERFMNRLTSNCSYMVGCKVLPKNSILYCRFNLYNELNKLKIDSEPIPVETRDMLIEGVFNNDRNVRITKSALKKFLVSNGLCEKESEISGVDEIIKANLVPYFKLKNCIGEKVDDSVLSEEIIRIITVFGDERKRLIAKLRKDFSQMLTDSEIESLSKIKFTEWGRLSKEFLTEVCAIDLVTGESKSIMSSLKATTMNLNELLSSRFGYMNEIKRINGELEGVSSKAYDTLVDDLYVSPAVKRSILRSMKIVNEIVDIVGHKPKKVFIETTREHQESKRTDSRKAKLLDLYKNCRIDSRDWYGEVEQLDEARLREKKLFLYYTQQGKCMYCGKNIDLAGLNDKSMYDIDHIIPQSIKTDDSIHNNLVLVHKAENVQKSDTYPLNLVGNIQSECASLWRQLRKDDFISEEKFNRLTRKTELSDDEKGGFIARQLVETSQSVKAVAETLDAILGNDTSIVYVKGGNVSKFRHDNGFVKSRDVNDFHHAKDAYLNIVVGNVYDEKFTRNPLTFVQSRTKYNLNQMFDCDIASGRGTVWKSGEDGSIQTVKKHMLRNNIRYTRMPYIRKGELFDANPLKKPLERGAAKKESTLMPIKKGLDVEDYGGYDNVKIAFFILVEHISKKKTVRSIESYPVHRAMLDSSNQAIEAYLSERGFESPKVVGIPIKFDSLMKVDGFRMTVSAKTGDSLSFTSAEQLIVSPWAEGHIKKIFKSVEVKTPLSIHDHHITSEDNVRLFIELMDKYEKPPFSNRFNSERVALGSVKETFDTFDLEKQVSILKSMVTIFHCNTARVSLKEIGGSSQAGIIFLSKKALVNTYDTEIIYQSITGLFEKSVSLR